jgi:TetR/AcrR family transcriptional regulator, regulator of cefoperazone and chloramphenicol sensitivity
MCSASARDRSDLTAKAAIRDEALRLFAQHGPDAVSLRQVAAAAGVSPGLVAHHYGSKESLRAAVDAHVAAVFDQMFTAIGTGGWDTAAGSSFTELIVSALPANSPIPAYLRRLLTSGDAAGAILFAA